MNAAACALTSNSCKPCEGGVPPLEQAEIDRLLKELPGWEQSDKELRKTYSFRNYYETMAFVNAIAYVAHREDHHPDLAVGYNRCGVTFTTHDAGGVTVNDCICAARIERLA